jgi:DNA-binding MarR family transcriptional regulator
MELAGLVIRKLDPEKPEAPPVALTDAGEALFHELLRAVVAFDARLRANLADQEIDAFTGTLDRLRGKVADSG